MYLAETGIHHQIAKKFHDLFCRPEWNIGIVREPIHSFLEPDAKAEIQWLPPLGRPKYLADPFGIAANGRMTILCEEYDYRTLKGVISSIEILEDGSPVRPKKVLEIPTHLSYPYLIQHNGEVYCVPETFEEREISLYKALEFPGRWERVASLVKDVRAHDSTLFRHGGRWWLAYTDFEKGSYDKLFLQYSPDLFGLWRPHALNPVKIDSRSSRSAGTPFVYQDQLYRPAQDCSRVYGKQIILNRVTRLSPTEFQEEEAGVVEPPRTGPYRDGIHTISAVGDATVIDAYRVVYIKEEFRRAVRRERNLLLTHVNRLLHGV